MTRAQAWRLDADGWDCIATGLRATYRRARRALRRARTDRATDDLHEWRKQTKYLWHQLQILTPLATGPVGELADEFHHLADYLGDEHDLAVLRPRDSRRRPPSSSTGAARNCRTRRSRSASACTPTSRKTFVHGLEKHWTLERQDGATPTERSATLT